MSKPLKIILIILAALAVLCIVCPLLWFSVSTTPYTKVIQKNWDIALPHTGAKDISGYSQPSPHGDGIRYHVIDYPVGNESAQMQNTVFQLEKLFLHAARPTQSQIACVRDLLAQIGVGTDDIPQLEKCRLLHLTRDDHSQLFLFYWSGTGTLYAVESFF